MQEESKTTKGFRVKPTQEVLNMFIDIKAELQSRGEVEYTFNEYLNDMYSNLKHNFKSIIVESKTPEHYKIMQALKDENLKHLLLKTIKQANKSKLKNLAQD